MGCVYSPMNLLYLLVLIIKMMREVVHDKPKIYPRHDLEILMQALKRAIRNIERYPDNLTFVIELYKAGKELSVCNRSLL